jgi:predicted RNA-binding protein with RPS1 domain
MIKDLQDVLEVVRRFGIYGVLLLLLILFVHDPGRAEKVKLVILTPFYRFLRWGTRQYLATRVSLALSEFFKHQISGLLTSVSNIRFKVRWVKTMTDPILKKNGTLILRLEETDDQTRNILSATKVALGHTICPTLRSQMQPQLQNAIDLVLLRKLTDRLGKYAQPVYLKYFLDPQTREDAECGALLKELLEIDRAGLFVTIFLEELNLLGEYAFSCGDRSDKTAAIKEFLIFLLGLARREKAAEIELTHVGEDFQVGVMLLAITQRATTEGVTPYVRRVHTSIREGCASVYIIAFKPAFSFQSSVVKAVADDVRVSVAKVSRVSVQPHGQWLDDRIAIVQLRIGRGFADVEFEQQLKDRGIAVGDHVTGKVIDVAEQVALVNVDGLNASVVRRQCDWRTVTSCYDVLSQGQVTQFQVIGIDKDRGMVILSRRFDSEDPFRKLAIPAVGDVVETTVVSFDHDSFIAERTDGLEIKIPFVEMSWMEDRPADPTKFVNSTIAAVIYEVNEVDRCVRGSLRKLKNNPWPEIHGRFPPGTRLRGSVIEVDRSLHFVRVEIADGITGIVPAESMIAAGYEYRDFENTVVAGQKLDVIVTKVFINKRRIRLELERNLVNGERKETPPQRKRGGV